MPRRAASRDRGHSRQLQRAGNRRSVFHRHPPAARSKQGQHRILQGGTLGLGNRLGNRLDLSAPQRGVTAPMFLKKLRFVIPANAGIQWSRH